MRVQQSKIGADPVKYYASLIGMEKHESRLKKKTNAIPIMTGIVLYRQLPKNKQSQILKQILGVSDNQLKASLCGLVSQVVANHIGSRGLFLTVSLGSSLIRIKGSLELHKKPLSNSKKRLPRRQLV